MPRSVLITGVGPVSAWGLGAQPHREATAAGTCALAPIRAFDASAYRTTIAGEVPDEFKVANHVPKSYRKATKVMARDIQLAVAAADLAVRDAGLTTAGTDPDAAKAGTLSPTYDPARVGCHIGAGLIAVEADEVTAAFVTARDPASGEFDMHEWGRVGMGNLTPLWLLKYLPNMLACHVTIVHDCRGPSNTITCNESSAGLSLGESFRVIERGMADACLCGGAESKLNPYAFFRQELRDWMTTDCHPAHAAVRPFDRNATGQVVGEGGAVIVLEAEDTFDRRNNPYCRISGVAASQSINRQTKNTTPDPAGLAIAAAIREALGDADLTPDDIDAVFPYGIGVPDYDTAEAAALASVFGDRLADLPVVSLKPFVGNCGAGSGGIDLAVAAACVKHQHLPPIVNRDSPIEGLSGNRDAGPAELKHVLVVGTGLGGQNTATVLSSI